MSYIESSDEAKSRLLYYNFASSELFKFFGINNVVITHTENAFKRRNNNLTGQMISTTEFKLVYDATTSIKDPLQQLLKISSIFECRLDSIDHFYIRKASLNLNYEGEKHVR